MSIHRYQQQRFSLYSVLVLIASALLALCSLSSSVGVQAASQIDLFEFPNSAMEARYRTLIAEFRCPKCLNTNLPGSDAPIAKDLRQKVYHLMVAEERSDDEIRDYLQSRYGDFVLYKPPFNRSTYLLWGAPVAMVIIGLISAFWVLRKSKIPVAELSETELARLQQILDDKR